MRFSVLLRPGSNRDTVGGQYAGALVVSVRVPAIDGAANAAALEILSKSFRVTKASLRLILGRSSPRKVFELLGAEEHHREILSALLATPPPIARVRQALGANSPELDTVLARRAAP